LKRANDYRTQAEKCDGSSEPDHPSLRTPNAVFYVLYVALHALAGYATLAKASNQDVSEWTGSTIHALPSDRGFQIRTPPISGVLSESVHNLVGVGLESGLLGGLLLAKPLAASSYETYPSAIPCN
jgi:hypothetical protein